MTLTLVSYDPTRDLSYREARSARAVTDWLAYLELGGKAARTLDEYERSLSRMCLMFPDKALEEITAGDLTQQLRSYPAPSRPARAAALRSFFKWAEDQERIDRNPCRKLPQIRAARPGYVDVFTDGEAELLCSLPVRDGALMAVLLDAGLRKGDALAFQWKHFIPEATEDGPDGKLVLLGGKGGKDRVVPASRRVAQKLGELAILDGLNRDDYLWYLTWRRAGVAEKIKRSSRPSEPVFERWWRRCLEAVDVRYRNPHVARHTFATRWIRRGARLQTLSMAMGHSSIQVTADRYSHLSTIDVALDLQLVQGPPE